MRYLNCPHTKAQHREVVRHKCVLCFYVRRFQLSVYFHSFINFSSDDSGVNRLLKPQILKSNIELRHHDNWLSL